jgi:hypothetical protein
MFTYGIAETGKRHTIKPTRARVMLARFERWLNSTQGASVFFTVLTCLLTTLIALAITTERASFLATLFSILSVFAILGIFGAMLVSDETSKRNAKQWRDIFAREYNAQQKEKHATITRADKAHALEIGTLAKQLLDTMRERDELRELVKSYESETRELAGALFDAKVNSGDIDFTNYGKDID